MLQESSFLRISDNSGGRKFKTIKILGGFKKRYGKVGEVIVGSVRGLRLNKKKKLKIKEGEVVRGLVVRTKGKVKRENLTETKFLENAVVLLNKKNQPLGSRVMGPVFRELRKSKYMKVASLSRGFI